MPRTKATTTTPELGDLDEHGLERLPEISANGHEAVRPSERCGTPAPAGAHYGARCEFADEHTGAHSWQDERAASSVATFTDESPAAQPTLPGTPEPEQNEYTVPTEASFGKAKLQPARGLAAIGSRLIADDDDLEHLRGVEIRYAWRRRGGTQGGNPRFARIKRPSVWESYFTGGTVEFFVDLSADLVREHRFTERQIEAALFDALSRTERDDDDHDAFRINGPDFKGNISTFRKYGAWEPSLREAHVHMAKLPLEQAIDEATEQDDDEGEESE